ncbi:MAG: nitroreductase family protein [Chitinophagaceae bacterium]|nr:nitroreductase family protein [Chitinophagaceae bacterium]
MALIEDLKWRYATKKMNGKSVPQEKADYILEAARLAPTSSGLQPFKIFVISNKELLEKIKPIAMGQSQITDCSHLLVFAAWDDYTLERITNVLSEVYKERQLPEAQAQQHIDQLWGMYEPLGQEWQQHDAAKQAYLSFGVAIAAAEQKVDATPMGGFDPAKLDELLELNKLGLRSVVLLPLGYREVENDWLVNLKKVRAAKEDLVTEIA